MFLASASWAAAPPRLIRCETAPSPAMLAVKSWYRFATVCRHHCRLTLVLVERDFYKLATRPGANGPQCAHAHNSRIENRRECVNVSGIEPRPGLPHSRRPQRVTPFASGFYLRPPAAKTEGRVRPEGLFTGLPSVSGRRLQSKV